MIALDKPIAIVGIEISSVSGAGPLDDGPVVVTYHHVTDAGEQFGDGGRVFFGRGPLRLDPATVIAAATGPGDRAALLDAVGVALVDLEALPAGAVAAKPTPPTPIGAIDG